MARFLPRPTLGPGIITWEGTGIRYRAFVSLSLPLLTVSLHVQSSAHTQHTSQTRASPRGRGLRDLLWCLRSTQLPAGRSPVGPGPGPLSKGPQGRGGWKTGCYCLTYFHRAGSLPGVARPGRPHLGEFPRQRLDGGGGVCLACPSPEARGQDPWVFHRKIHTFLLVKGLGRLPSRPAERARSLGHWDHLATARHGSWRLLSASSPGTLSWGWGRGGWSVEVSWVSQTFPLVPLPPWAMFLTHLVAVVCKTQEWTPWVVAQFYQMYSTGVLWPDATSRLCAICHGFFLIG